jgi:hypothetical protein
LTADFATWVELRRTSAVAVSSPDEGLLASDITLLCHNVVDLVAPYYHERSILQVALKYHYISRIIKLTKQEKHANIYVRRRRK